jgi:hypothetical protein
MAGTSLYVYRSVPWISPYQEHDVLIYGIGNSGGKLEGLIRNISLITNS